MTGMFLLNLLLAAVYVMLMRDTSGVNIAIGFIIGYVVLAIYGMAIGTTDYSRKLIRLIRFGFWFMWILTKANLQIMWEIITPGMHQTPRILRYPVSHLNEIQITTLANAITLTPGTLVVDVSDDHAFLYVHCMYAKDRESAICELDELEHRLRKEVFS